MKVPRGIEVMRHFAGVAVGLAIFAGTYAIVYGNSGSTPNAEREHYLAVDANNYLMSWRIGATKALSRDAQIRLVFSTEDTCAKIHPASGAKVQRVTSVVAGSLWQPAELKLATQETSLGDLCRTGASMQAQYWATESTDLKQDLQRLGLRPAFFAAAW